MSRKLVQIGMDDIDSPDGGCTTHFASLVVEKLGELNVEWTDYPNLIRLNPGIPYRTRGNGAVALRFMVEEKDLYAIPPLVEEFIHDYVNEEYPNTNPGVVFLEEEVPRQVHAILDLALWRVVPIQLARRVIQNHNITHYTGGNGRGLIGALSSVANTLSGDHTYEYIAYRSLDDCGDSREVDEESVRVMDQKMGNRVFSNVDPTSNRIMIEPHGPDPVLYGVRGESAEDVIEAGKQVRSKQKVDRWMTFRSNQGTGAHLTHQVEIRNLRPYMCAQVLGRVETKPQMIEGGHTIFRIEDDSGKVDCAVYEPSGEFRDIIMKLVVGDLVKIHAGVRPASRTHGLTLNLEGLEVIKLVQAIEFENPKCPNCGKRMKSAGRDKGYKCTKCGHKDSKAVKTETQLDRDLDTALYLPPTRAQRHLTRPLSRIDMINSGVPRSLVATWYSH
ncbi:MAG: DUF1743 domain-containing protein [Candidatus Thorarchaeota archaeon]